MAKDYSPRITMPKARLDEPMTSKRNLVVLGIIAAAIVVVGYLALTGGSGNRRAKKYEDGYAQIKVGDSKETVVGVLGQPTRISEFTLGLPIKSWRLSIDPIAERFMNTTSSQ